MIPCFCFLRMALTYIVPVRYCMNRGSANGAPAGGAFLVDIPTEAVAEVRGPDELRLLIFPQPLDGALKNQNAAPASPPCFRRWRRSALLLFKSRARLNKKASTRMCTCFFKSEQRDLNPRPPRPERGALPTALCPENTAAYSAAVTGWG